jgi:hypothetical protein
MKEKTWIDEMIERESTPKPLREGKMADFCAKWGIDSSTYYYQARKKENQKKVIDIWLSEAVKGGNEVLEKLRQNAINGKEKSIEMYLKFVLELKERMDVTTKDEAITITFGEEFKNYGTDSLAKNSSTES